MNNVIDEREEVATEDISCNACCYLNAYLDENWTDTKLTFSEWRSYIKAREKGYKILKGETMRVYEVCQLAWCGNPPEPDHDEWYTIYEIPEIAAICTRLGLWA